MNKKINSLILLLSVNLSYADNKLTFDQKITKSGVIFIGKTIDRYEQMESIQLDKDNSIEQVYTTHVFIIEDVLKGHFDDKTISVKLRGGCDEGLGKCGKYNVNTYYFEEEPLERVLLFLSYDKLNNFYYSTYDNKSAFLIHGSIEVITDTEWVPIFAPTNKEKTDEDTITLDILKNKIGAKYE